MEGKTSLFFHNKESSIHEEEETDNCNLLPISKLFPAKDLLPREYPPDDLPKIMYHIQHVESNIRNKFIRTRKKLMT